MKSVSLIASLLLLCSITSRADLFISEFLASNQDSISDEDGDNEDWIEIFNSGSQPVDLGGYHLTDKADNLDKWTFPTVTIPANGYLVVFASSKDRTNPNSELHTNFGLSKGGEYLALTAPNNNVIHAYAPEYPSQVTDASYGIPQSGNTTTIVSQNASAYAGVPSSAQDFTSNFNGWNLNSTTIFTGSTWRPVTTGVGYDTASTFGTWLGNNGSFQTEMLNSNTSLFLRIPFQVTTPSDISSLTLRMRYDDGFVAYINGTQVATDNAPQSPAWDSISLSDRPDSFNNDWELFTIDLSQANLTAGQNILAIQGMNVRTGSSDMLILPELDATQTTSTGTQKLYFIQPTPGAVNGTGSVELPPSINNTTERFTTLPTGGSGSSPLIITSEISETANPVSSVNLRYRIMFGSESQIQMRDNGNAPDQIANDGIYTASIPTTSMNAGQMIRWRIIAQDNQSNSATSPPYLDPADSDQYFGTIATDPAINTSLLPVLHWFIQTPSAANDRSGTRASFFYLGEFYDNIQVDLHGQTTAGFAKKSYDIDFNKGNRFTWKENEGKVKDINLLTNWADKTKLRNTLAYEVFKTAGAAHHFAFPVRVQQNGQFFSIADMVEDGDDRFLERIGFDPDGALYKMYNKLDSTGNASKKTRQNEDKSDLQTLVSSLTGNINDQRLYAYDNIDIPETVNYLAGLAIAGSQDQGHKNYYVYRDTNNTGEWMPIVWDLDLSFGHDWGGQGYFDDDLEYQNPLHLGFANRLKEVIWNSPELNEMFVRRVRTLMDEQIQPSSTPLAQRYFENKINFLIDQIDPSGLTSDADLDFTKWGAWRDGGSSSTASSHNARNQAQRLIDDYLPNRRSFLYGSQPESYGLPIPSAQSLLPNISIQDIDYLPSDSQAAEYFVLKNNTSDAVDISGWEIRGAVEHTFKGGTIIPSGNGSTASQYKGLLHVAKSSKDFRARTTGPTGGEYRLIQGGYDGQLSARGETIELWDKSGNLIATQAYAGSPTLAQTSLRITEINYHPSDPTSAELGQDDTLTDSDFEFIELTNIGNQALDLSGAAFTEGIGFTFPTSSILFPGQRIILASNPAAFALRYPTAQSPTGSYTGQLNNAGETIRLSDITGENILVFEYSDQWYPPSDGDGYSLVLRDTSTAYNDFDQPESWAISSTTAGTPGISDPTFQSHFQGWFYAKFSKAQREDPAVSSLTADPDNDGYDNWSEYAFATDPFTPDAPRVTPTIVTHQSSTYLALTFERAINPFDITWSVKSSTTPSAFTNEASTPHGANSSISSSKESATLRTSTTTATPAKFFQIQATTQAQP